jgi:hypothetical protein
MGWKEIENNGNVWSNGRVIFICGSLEVFPRRLSSKTPS